MTSEARHTRITFPEPLSVGPSRQGTPYPGTAGLLAPSEPEDAIVPPQSAVLYKAGRGAFNIDPDSPFLEVGASEVQQATVAGDDRERFVGGFLPRLRRLFKSYHHPSGRRAAKEEQEYFAPIPITRAPPENRFASPPHSSHYSIPPPPTITSVLSQSTAQAAAQPHPPPPPPSSPAQTRQHPSRIPPPPPSEAGRESDDMYQDGETTVVGHEGLPQPATSQSPVYVSPELGPDYAKMESPSPAPSSISTFSAYMDRVRKFFHDINELPWVAERITVDYYPGQNNKRRARPRPPGPPPPRPVMSWYNRQPVQQQRPQLDLLASPPRPQVIFRTAEPGEDVSSLPIAAVVMASNPEAQAQAQAQTQTQTQTQARVQLNASPSSSSSSSPSPIPFTTPDWAKRRTRPAGYGKYPTGYVPPGQQDAVAAQYRGLAIHAVTQPSTPAL